MPVFVLDILNFIISKIKLVIESFIQLIYSTIKNSMLIFSKLNYGDFKISSIRKVIKDSYFNFKNKMYLEDLSNEKDIGHNSKDTLLNTYILNRNNDSSSSRNSSGRHRSSGRHHSSGGHHSSGNSRSNNSSLASQGGNINTDSVTRTNNNVVQSTTNNVVDNRFLFVVDTFNDGRGSIAIASPAPSVAPLASHEKHNSSYILPNIAYVPSQNHNSSYTYAPLPSTVYVPNNNNSPVYVPNNSPIPEMPRAPVPSNLSTPSTMTPLFESPISVPRAPVQTNLSTPSTMSPLFPPQENLNYQAPNNEGVVNNIRYSSSHYSNSIASTPAPNNTNTRNNYPNSIASTTTYASTDKGQLGLNGSNERL
jgi:hypothetical protein